MVKFAIRPSQPSGRLEIPTSKSHTLRALVFSLMAKGTSRIYQFLPSPDTEAMIKAIRLLGAKVEKEGKLLTVCGTGGTLLPADDVIDCGNSGQVLRFIGALAALSPSYTILTGDVSIRRNRPVKPLLEGLTHLGAFAESSRGDGYAPIIVKGPMTKQKTSLSGEDSQPVSALLIACSFLPHPTDIRVVRPGEKPWIGLTLRWLDRFDIGYENRDFEHYRLKGGASIPAFDYTVPGDFSSAAFPIAAALLTHSEITLHPIDMEDPQGDKAIIPLLEKMGARFEINAAEKTLTVKKSPRLKGRTININDFIDALPILAVIACFCEGTTEIINASIARNKESDRIHCIAIELAKMGADIEERPDGLVIRPAPLRGSAHLETHHDHRLVLALSVAALAAEGESVIHGVEAAAKTYTTFLEDFLSLGAKIERSD
jgi:3-phosphoshikimate 1-carboxyvinyltransferase